MIKILLVGKRKQPITWASIYLKDRHKFTRIRFLDGVRRIVKTIYGPHFRYYDFPWERRFNVYNTIYRLDKNAWAGFMERRVRKLSNNVVIDDPHYVNEVNYLVDNLNFIVVRIDFQSKIKPTPGRALLDSEPGTVLLQEHYGASRTSPYKVEFTLTVYSRQQLYGALDSLVETLKLEQTFDYNTTEEDLVEPPDPAIWEGLPKTHSEVVNEEKECAPDESINRGDQ